MVFIWWRESPGATVAFPSIVTTRPELEGETTIPGHKTFVQDGTLPQVIFSGSTTGRNNPTLFAFTVTVSSFLSRRPRSAKHVKFGVQDP